MAEFKRLIVSGSPAHLNSLSVGTYNSDASNNQISSSGKMFASSSEGGAGTGGGSVDHIVVNVGGEFKYIAQSEISNTPSDALTFGSGITTDQATYNGSAETNISTNLTSLTSGNGLTTSANKILAVGGTNISVGVSGISVDVQEGGGLFNDAKGFKYDETSDSMQIRTGSSNPGIGFNGTGELFKLAPNVAGGVKGLALTSGDGIQTLSFDYEDDERIQINSGSLVDNQSIGIGTGGDVNKFVLKESARLNTNTLAILASDGFRSSSVSSSASEITIAKNVSTGDSTVQFNGTSSFGHSTDFTVSDKFILVNSSSTAASTDNWGFMGQNGADGSDALTRAFAYSGSGNARRWVDSTGRDSDNDGGKLVDLVGSVRLHLEASLALEGNPNANAYTQTELQLGNTVYDRNNDVFWIYT